MPKRTNDGLKKRCACGKRKWAKCPHPWQFSFHAHGHEHRYSLDAVARARGKPLPRSRTEAETWRDLLRNEIRNNVFSIGPPPAAPDGRLALGEVCDRYLKKHVQREGRREGGRELMEFYLAALRRSQVESRKDSHTIRTRPSKKQRKLHPSVPKNRS